MGSPDIARPSVRNASYHSITVWSMGEVIMPSDQHVAVLGVAHNACHYVAARKPTKSSSWRRV